MSKLLLSIQTRLPAGAATCSYCLLRTQHSGSHASCPFKSKTAARAAAAAATSKLEAGMTKAAIAEALAEAE
jgi:aminoglycoside phosphotransferase